MSRARWRIPRLWAALIVLIFLSSSFFRIGGAQDESYYIGETDKIELILNDTVHMTWDIGGDNRNPVIMEDAVGSVVVFWDHQDPTTGTMGTAGMPTREIFMSMADRWGTAFGNASRIDLGCEDRDKRNVDLAISNRTNRYYIVWEQQSTDGKGTIHFARSLDRGGTFEGIKEIEKDFSSCKKPRVAVSYEEHIYCVFLAQTNVSGKYQFYFVHSNNGGDTFSDPIQVSDPGNGQCNTTSLAVDDRYVYFTWEANNRVYFDRYSLENKDLTGPRTIDLLDRPIAYQGPHYVHNPIVTSVSNGKFYVLWDDNREGEFFRWVFLTISDDYGSYFTSGVVPGAYNDEQKQQGFGSMDFAPDGDLYLVYRNGYDIHLKRTASGEMEEPQYASIITHGKRTGTPRILTSGEGCLVAYELGSKESSSGPRDLLIAQYIEVIIPKPSDGNDDTDEKKWYQKTWPIALFAIIILAIAFIVMGKWNSSKRKEEELARMKKDAAASQGGARKKKKREDTGDKKGFDREKLTRELKEKKTALLLLEAELESKNISRTEYEKLKKEYEDRIGYIERKVGGRKNPSTYG